MFWTYCLKMNTKTTIVKQKRAPLPAVTLNSLQNKSVITHVLLKNFVGYNNDGLDVIPSNPNHARNTSTQRKDATETLDVEEEDFLQSQTPVIEIKPPIILRECMATQPPPKRQRTKQVTAIGIMAHQKLPFTSPDKSHPFTIQIAKDFEQQRELFNTGKVDNLKASRLVSLLWNCHSDEISSPVLMDFMHLGKIQFSSATIDELANCFAHPCKFPRYAAWLCLIKMMKDCKIEELEQVFAQYKTRQSNQPVCHLVMSIIQLFVPIKMRQAGMQYNSQQKIMTEEFETEPSNNLILKLENVMESAVDEFNLNCDHCTQWGLTTTFSLKYIMLMYKVVLSENSTPLIDELLIKLCDYPGPETVQIMCQLSDEQHTKTFHIHCQVLEVWTKTPESPRCIETHIHPSVVQNFVYILYHDNRKKKEDLIENSMQLVELSGLLQIPQYWKVLDAAYAFLMETIPSDILQGLLRNPKIWIHNENVLRNLSVDNMKLIIGSDHLRLKEIDVLRLCNRWANVSKTETFSAIERFTAIEKLIRFPQIPYKEYSAITNEAKDLVFQAIKRIEMDLHYTPSTNNSATPHLSTPRIL